MNLTIREETPDDAPIIAQTHWLGFNRANEADLVERLRGHGLIVTSLVATNDDGVIGHVMFSQLPIKTSHEILAGVALAPIAVWPNWRKRGIGSKLIRKGLDICRERNYKVVVVLGDPTYYSCFGFSSALARQLRGPFSGDNFMVLELVPKILHGITGEVNYPEPFQSVS